MGKMKENPSLSATKGASTSNTWMLFFSKNQPAVNIPSKSL